MLLSNMFLSIFELRRFSVTINVFVLSVLSDSLLALAYLVTSDNVMRDALSWRKLTHCTIYSYSGAKTGIQNSYTAR